MVQKTMIFSHRSLRHYGALACILATLMVAGCGIKPGSLKQPEGTQPNDFPRDYPQE